MKYFLLSLLLTSAVIKAGPGHFSPKVIKEVESKYLEKYKDLTDRQKLEKYIIAISELSELRDYKAAIILAESAYNLKNKTLEFYGIYLELLKTTEDKSTYIKIFEDVFLQNFKLRDEESKETMGDIILNYLLLSSKLPNELDTKIERIFNSVQTEYIKERSLHVRSIILARNKHFKEALSLLSVKDTSGLEELLFISYLQRMSGAKLTVVTQLLSQIYSDALYIIKNEKIELINEKLKASGDILTDSYLYEVLK